MLMRNSLLHPSSMKVETQRQEDIMGAMVKVPSNQTIVGGKDDESDEYFSDSPDEIQSQNSSPDSYSQDVTHPKFSLAVAFVKKLHVSAVQRKGHSDSEDDFVWEDNLLCNNDNTFPNDPTGDMPNSWGTSESALYQVRGDTFFIDRKKIMGRGSVMQLVAANWLRSGRRQDDLAGRPGSIVQRFAAAGNPDFFFVVNMQIPGANTNYHLAFYYMASTPVKDPLLKRFIEGDDEYRNSRFKLIPHVSKGPWIVKQSVGTRACLLGQILNIKYIRGKNYLELDVDVGSSKIARKVASLVLGSFSNLIVEVAFLLQANTEEELPEHILGSCRLNYIDISKASWV